MEAHTPFPKRLIETEHAIPGKLPQALGPAPAIIPNRREGIETDSDFVPDHIKEEKGRPPKDLYKNSTQTGFHGALCAHPDHRPETGSVA
ncbi:hypothetical protein AAC387_Pa01g0240 [Persea americana]